MVVLFFTKDGPTTKPINYCEFDLKGVSLGKMRPLNEGDLAEFEGMAKGWANGMNATNGTTATAATSPSRWTLDPAMLDLSVNNPNRIIFPG